MTSQTPGTPPPEPTTSEAFRQLVSVIARLRSPTGCPWDREQTLASIRPYTLEETFEVLEAIDADDNSAMCEELGDLLLQVLLYAQIAQDEGRFTLPAILTRLSDKLVRRHPHVFGEEQAETPDQVVHHWERVKREEQSHRTSRLEGVPVDLPALARQARLQSKIAKAGIHWPTADQLLPEIQQRMAHLSQETASGVSSGAFSPREDRELLHSRERQFGELLFLMAEWSRRSGVNPEDALRSTNLRVQQEFQRREQAAREQGREIAEPSSAPLF